MLLSPAEKQTQLLDTIHSADTLADVRKLVMVEDQKPRILGEPAFLFRGESGSPPVPAELYLAKGKGGVISVVVYGVERIDRALLLEFISRLAATASMP